MRVPVPFKSDAKNYSNDMRKKTIPTQMCLVFDQFRSK